VGGGPAKDTAVVDSINRLLPLLQNEIQAEATLTDT